MIRKLSLGAPLPFLAATQTPSTQAAAEPAMLRAAPVAIPALDAAQFTAPKEFSYAAVLPAATPEDLQHLTSLLNPPRLQNWYVTAVDFSASCLAATIKVKGGEVKFAYRAGRQRGEITSHVGELKKKFAIPMDSAFFLFFAALCYEVEPSSLRGGNMNERDAIRAKRHLDQLDLFQWEVFVQSSQLQGVGYPSDPKWALKALEFVRFAQQFPERDLPEWAWRAVQFHSLNSEPSIAVLARTALTQRGLHTDPQLVFQELNETNTRYAQLILQPALEVITYAINLAYAEQTPLALNTFPDLSTNEIEAGANPLKWAHEALAMIEQARAARIYFPIKLHDIFGDIPGILRHYLASLHEAGPTERFREEAAYAFSGLLTLHHHLKSEAHLHEVEMDYIRLKVFAKKQQVNPRLFGEIEYLLLHDHNNYIFDNARAFAELKKLIAQAWETIGQDFSTSQDSSSHQKHAPAISDAELETIYGDYTFLVPEIIMALRSFEASNLLVEFRLAVRTLYFSLHPDRHTQSGITARDAGKAIEILKKITARQAWLKNRIEILQEHTA